MEKDLLATVEFYHVFNKSIAGFQIFNNESEYKRMIDTVYYYRQEKPPLRFSKFYINSNNNNSGSVKNSLVPKGNLVEIIAYCIMPTHIHLLLKQIKEGGMSIFMRNILDSYTRYFNIRHKRKGPLWESRFKRILIKTNQQLLHLTRYIHLNPATAYLVNKPEDWFASSYREYLLQVGENDRICNFKEILELDPPSYKDFVEDRISYQRDLAKIKDELLDSALQYTS